MAQRYEIPFAGHLFVWARPLVRTWSYYDGATMAQGRDEFRPVMVRGHDTGQGVYCQGSAYHYPMEDFEFGEVISMFDPISS